MWADFRGMNNSLYNMGKKINEYVVQMDKGSGREGSTYVFMNRDILEKIYTETEIGFDVVSVDEGNYMENNAKMKYQWYYIVATKR